MRTISYTDEQALDQCLDQLTGLLRALGVEEMFIDEHSQYHRLNTEHPADPVLLNEFGECIADLHEFLAKQHISISNTIPVSR